MGDLIILCLLGDPMLPAVSVKHTGGFQVDIQELLSHIHNPGCTIHVITNTSVFCQTVYEETGNCIIHRIRVEDAWLDDQNLLMKHISQIREELLFILKKIVRDGVPSLIHSFYWLSGILAMEAKKEMKIDYVHSVVSLAMGKILGGSSPYFSDQLAYEKAFLKDASAIFAITETEKEQLQTYYDVPPKKIIVVGRGVHPAFLNPSHRFDGTPAGISQDVPSIRPVELMNFPWWSQGAYTYVGRLQTIKGLQYIFAAWLRLYRKHRNRTPPLWICGGTPEGIRDFRVLLPHYIGKDTSLLEECEKYQKIIWWGYLDAAGISTLFMKTRVMVTHSQYEPGGRVLLEALSASVPVIATPNGFAKDLIRNRANGLLVNYGRVDELTDAMEYFMSAENELLKMKENAHNTYKSQWEKWKCYRSQFDVYHQLGLAGFSDD